MSMCNGALSNSLRQRIFVLLSLFLLSKQEVLLPKPSPKKVSEKNTLLFITLKERVMEHQFIKPKPNLKNYLDVLCSPHSRRGQGRMILCKTEMM
jgi:hypothetical protein